MYGSVSFQTPVTSKPVEVRMGKGKGSVDYCDKVKPGRIMFEIDGVNDEIAREALRLAAMKLPVTRVVVLRLVRSTVSID